MDMNYAVRATFELLNLSASKVAPSKIRDQEGLDYLIKMYDPLLFSHLFGYQETSGAPVFFPALTKTNPKSFPAYSKFTSREKF